LNSEYSLHIFILFPCSNFQLAHANGSSRLTFCHAKNLSARSCFYFCENSVRMFRVRNEKDQTASSNLRCDTKATTQAREGNRLID
jgi:hypothetical protein